MQNQILAILGLNSITLLALGLKLRPSDTSIAPKGELFDSLAGETKNFIFTTNMLSFSSDGLHITLLGIKTDFLRTWFDIFLPFSQDLKIDPVATLQVYLNRTNLSDLMWQYS